MVNNKNFAFIFFGIFILSAFVLSLNLTSAYIDSINITSNATNGSSWFKGGSNQSINYSIQASFLNASTNLTTLNITVANGTTLWGATILTNNTNLTCGTYNSTYANCTGFNAASFVNFNITLNMTLNASSLEQNHTVTFIFADNFTSTNTTRMLIEVDGISPTITTPFYAWYMNQTSIKNSTSDQLKLNISVSDSGSGGGHCYTNINGTNQTFAVSSGWCNFTVGNLTGLANGNRTLNLYINDSVNNLIVNSTLVLQIDTVGPVVSHSCTPEPVTQGSTLTCTCTATDATSGVNSTQQVFTANPSTGDTGSYNSQCTQYDYGGTKTESLAAYNVVGGNSNSGGGSGGGSSGTTWTTQTITDAVLAKGFIAQLAQNNRVKFTVAGASHTVGVISVTTTKATIEIASDPVRVTLAPGEDAKVDLNGDGYYDIKVVLNSIMGTKADLTITKINEVVPAEQESSVETTGEVEETVVAEPASGNKAWIWIVVVIVLVLIIGGAAAKKKKR